jgi:hypothetical protein
VFAYSQGCGTDFGLFLSFILASTRCVGPGRRGERGRYPRQDQGRNEGEAPGRRPVFADSAPNACIPRRKSSPMIPVASSTKQGPGPLPEVLAKRSVPLGAALLTGAHMCDKPNGHPELLCWAADQDNSGQLTAGCGAWAVGLGEEHHTNWHARGKPCKWPAGQQRHSLRLKRMRGVHRDPKNTFPGSSHPVGWVAGGRKPRARGTRLVGEQPASGAKKGIASF